MYGKLSIYYTHSMKKLSIILLSAFAIISCQKEDGSVPATVDGSVVIKASAGNILDRNTYTSTDYTTTSFINGDEIGIYTIHPEDAADPTKMLDEDYPYVYSNSAWVPKDPLKEIRFRRSQDGTVWRTMNFYAYYPHSAVVGSPVTSITDFTALFELPTDQTNPDVFTQSCVLRAIPILDKSNEDPVVPFVFKHVPTLIEMQIYKDNWEPSEVPRLSQVSISGCYVKGQFALNGSEVEIQPGANAATVNHNFTEGSYPALTEESSNTPLIVRFMIMPKEMASDDKLSFEFSVTGDNIQDPVSLGRYICEMPNLVESTPVKFLSANKYTYKVKLQKQKVIIQFGAPDEWGNGTIIDIGVIRPETEDTTMGCTTSLVPDGTPNYYLLPLAATEATMSISSGLYNLSDLSVQCDYGTPSAIDPVTGTFTISNIPKVAADVADTRITTIDIMHKFGSDANKGIIKTYYLKHQKI